MSNAYEDGEVLSPQEAYRKFLQIQSDRHDTQMWYDGFWSGFWVGVGLGLFIGSLIIAICSR